MTTTPDISRDTAAAELLQSLMSVKSWLNETHRWLHEHHHSGASLLGLALLEQHGPARVGELAERARVDASVVSRQMQQLEAEGLVARTPDPDDGRASLLSLTPAGRQLLDDGRSRLAVLVTDRLSGWTPEQMSAFGRTLRRLVDDLQAPPPA